MAICARCETEQTESYENSVPICVKCATIRDAEAKEAPKQSRDVHATLVQGLCKATTHAHSANVEFNAIMDRSPSGLSNPDGTNSVNNASRKLSAARKGVMDAHNRLNDFLARGVVPEDLKWQE